MFLKGAVIQGLVVVGLKGYLREISKGNFKKEQTAEPQGYVVLEGFVPLLLPLSLYVVER